MKKILNLTICLLLSISTISQNYPIKNIKGTDYYVYTVQAGEGLYRISKKFNVLQSDIYKINPDLNKGLKEGQTLYIPTFRDNTKSKELSSKIVEHKVVAKETLYSISKMYSVNQNDILELNPEIENNLIRLGQIIKIPVSDNNIEKSQEKVIKQINSNHEATSEQKVEKQIKKKYVTYEVKDKKETLYSISKQFGITINELIEANPYAQNGIKKGDILQVPITEKDIPKKIENNISHIVKSKETIYGISKKYSISQDELIKSNPRLNSGLKEGDTIIIKCKNEEDYLSKINANNLENKTSTKEVANAKRHYKVVYLLPFSASEDNGSANTDKFMEFYRGALIALEKIKSSGISLDVYTFDTQFGTKKTEDILKNKMPKNIDLIIGPAYPEQVSLVANYAKKNNIIQVVPFTSKVEASDKFPLQYQFNPPSIELNKMLSTNILESFGDNNILFVNFENRDKKSFIFYDIFKKSLQKKSIAYREISESSSPDNFISNINKNKKTLIVISPCNNEEFGEFANKISKHNLNNCTFVADEDIFNLISSDYQSSNIKNYITFSPFNASPTDSYLSNYNQYFMVRTEQYTPNYDLLGYDISLYFCSATKNGNSLLFNEENDMLQSAFNFKKQGISYLNMGCFIYIMRNNSLKIEKI